MNWKELWRGLKNWIASNLIPEAIVIDIQSFGEYDFTVFRRDVDATDEIKKVAGHMKLIADFDDFKWYRYASQHVLYINLREVLRKDS